MNSIYGRDRTNLSLTAKANHFYSGTDPLTIIEHEDYDANDEPVYTYTIKEREWNVIRPITEDELIRWLEDMDDANENDQNDN